MTVIAEASDGANAIALYNEHKPDVVLMDLRMPNVDGVAAIREIVQANPDARIVALTTYDGDADIYRALDAGASGYLIKDMLGDELVKAVRTAAAGKRIIPPVVAGRLAEFTPRVDLTALSGGIGSTITWADRRNMAFDFGITREQAARRRELIEAGDGRLREGDAVAFTPGAGFKELRTTAQLGYAIYGPWQVVGVLSEGRLAHDVAESPLARKSSATTGALGFVYRF